MANKTNGKKSSKQNNVAPRRRVRIPADQLALRRWGRKCVWTGSDYIAVPMGSSR